MKYPSDLTTEEWNLISHFFKPKTLVGSACKHDTLLVVNAILYLVKGGIQWRMLPKDFPPWKTVYYHFSKWNKSGVWDEALKHITMIYREKAGRKKIPATES